MALSKTDILLRNVQKKINPDLRILSDVDLMIKNINTVLQQQRIRAHCVAGGSIAKRTFLKNDHDVDLFVRFDPFYSDEVLPNLLESVIKKITKSYVRVHGSRDYFQFTKKSKKYVLDFEVIPVIAVTDPAQARNVTDLSPEHVTWVTSYTQKNPSLVDEIRLAKQFCKSIGVYGAESYIKGLSGHILDILCIHFQSFLSMIQFFAKQPLPLVHAIIIDHEQHMQNPLTELNESKLGPLIIVDPIQTNRNAAAAVSKERLEQLIVASKQFLKKPSVAFFVIKKKTPTSIIAGWKTVSSQPKSHSTAQSKKSPRIQTQIIAVSIKNLNGSKDVVGTKILKVHEYILQKFSEATFEVLHHDMVFDYAKKQSTLLYQLPAVDLSVTVEQQGPFLHQKTFHDTFVQKHRREKLFTKQNRIYAQAPRQYRKPLPFLKKIALDDPIKTRVKKIVFRRKS